MHTQVTMERIIENSGSRVAANIKIMPIAQLSCAISLSRVVCRKKLTTCNTRLMKCHGILRY